MTIYLYVKTHRKTGLKYFGKTIKDPLTYKGSGTRWLHHIRKHGDDCVTEIIGSYDDPDKCEMAALKFSLENDIVASNAWANLKPENGKDGMPPGGKHTPETKAKMSASKKNMSQETKAKMSASRKGVIHTDEHKNGIKFSHWDRNPAWKIADSLYNSWLEHGRPGRTRMSEIHPGIRVDKIVRSFKEGWVPSKDELWNVYKLKKENRNDD